MNDQDDNLGDEVVIVEERNKTSYAYIAIAAVVGLAVGGLGGALLTQNSWQKTYSSAEERVQKLEGQKVVLQQQVTSYKEDVEKKITQVLEDQKQALSSDFDAQLKELETTVTELEKVNLDQEKLIAEQKSQLEAFDKSNRQLNRQADLQASMFERSREVFQREMLIKQEMETLQTERKTLLPQVDKLKNECDVFLEGASWDASSNACDKSDEVTSRLSQIDQMLEVHRLDLEQIQSLAEQMGLN
ncbi:chromosome partitioning protein ParA [Vibrio sp. SCSIO 43136]|nr:chromosome partitioning protein ParA [Vibrio sp. SCSIO 43136]